MIYSFLELLIFFWFWYLVFRVYFSLHQRNIVCKYKLHRKLVVKQQTYLLVSDIDLEITCFLMLKNLKKYNLWINFNFSQFYENVFRSSHSQMLFKIDLLKIFAMLRIKNRLQHMRFPVRSSCWEVFLKKVFCFVSRC